MEHQKSESDKKWKWKPDAANQPSVWLGLLRYDIILNGGRRHIFCKSLCCWLLTFSIFTAAAAAAAPSAATTVTRLCPRQQQKISCWCIGQCCDSCCCSSSCCFFELLLLLLLLQEGSAATASAASRGVCLESRMGCNTSKASGNAVTIMKNN